MSILLEALRKTEQQQRPAPTIHDEDPAGSTPEPLLSWPMVAMMAVALVVSGWAVWRQYAAPEGVYRPPVTLVSSQAAGTQTQAARESAVDTPAGEAATPPAKVATSPATATQKPPAQSPQRSQRTPVETYNPPAAETPAPGSARETGESKPAAPATNTARRPAADATATSARGAAKPTPETGTPEAVKPHIPEPIGYWELPDAVRANVPEIKFSVLVYDADPEGRFVLINGQRLGEGDELQQGLAVGEIRRDGVVFTYRLYRFFVGR
jgi:hypothetical protein